MHERVIFTHPTQQASDIAVLTHDSVPVQHMNLPPLPTFGGKGQDDGDAFDQWCCKFDRYAELQKWSSQDELLQFELHLTR